MYGYARPGDTKVVFRMGRHQLWEGRPSGPSRPWGGRLTKVRLSTMEQALFSEITPVYWGTIRALFRALTGPFFSIRGSFGFEDPCLTAIGAGLAYGIGGAAYSGFPGVKWDVVPDFEDPGHDLQVDIAFQLRPWRLLGPVSRLGWKVLRTRIRMRRQEDERRQILCGKDAGWTV